MLISEGFTTQAVEPGKHNRKPTNLSLGSELLQDAKALGINVSRSAEAGITEAVRRYKRQQWLEGNAAAFHIGRDSLLLVGSDNIMLAALLTSATAARDKLFNSYGAMVMSAGCRRGRCMEDECQMSYYWKAFTS